MGGITRRANWLSIGIAALGGLLLLADGTLRLFLADERWLFQALGTDVVPVATDIFQRLRWPTNRIMLLVPFLGAWEIAIAMFLVGAFYEQVTQDTDDLVPGSAMLILGLAMLVSSAAILMAVASLAGLGPRMVTALSLPAMAALAGLVAALAERLAAENAPPLDPGPSVAIVLFKR